MPYTVRENLSIGNIGDAAEILENGAVQSVTHILSVLSSASISFFSEWKTTLSIPAKEITKVHAADAAAKSALPPEKLLYSLEYAGRDLKLVRMAVPLRDTEKEDLLDYLEACIDFIDRGRKEGSVLVHCFAGVSRSAAVITAYLMRTERLSVEDALESLRQSCEFVCPNDGFLEQLKMFEGMGFKVDHSSPIYKRFRLKLLCMASSHRLFCCRGLVVHLIILLNENHFSGLRIDSSKLGADPGMPVEVSSEAEETTKVGNNRRPTYRCKKCRRLVALQEHVIDHVPGEGERAFEFHKRRGGNPFNKSDEFECSSIFIEPLRWMKAVEEGAMEGKLSCAHCDARLGYFNWSGIQCSCGSWITPAFQLHKGRIDISPM
ncbi:Dual specificity protein phosphatase 12 [Glycine soja]